MTTVLWTGTVVGAVLGLIHAAYVFRVVTADGTATRARASYHAVWTLGLWLLFGGYVLALWLIGVVFHAVFKAFR